MIDKALMSPILISNGHIQKYISAMITQQQDELASKLTLKSSRLTWHDANYAAVFKKNHPKEKCFENQEKVLLVVTKKNRFWW